ncbi:condensation domain-containing protein, partial [Nodularia sp. UHCC 0506]|uniref:condensation domain-containing protein n=1 Tax=Nodularia sp. UHCC 0506 TaxID=3110243 RepID=UPI002B21D19D
MKPIDQLLSYLNSLDIQFRIDGDRIYCNDPQGMLTSELKQQLRDRKQEILQFIHHNRQSSQSDRILPVSRDTNLPLSFAQQRLWFLNQLEPNNPIYNLSFPLRLLGQLNIEALKQSLNEIVRRHEVLRTTFTIIDKKPVQAIAPVLTLKLPIIDLENLPETAQKTQVSQLVTQEAQLLFDLEQGPLLRASLLKLSQQEYIALFTMHHIVSDGWSIEILIKELGVLYEAFCRDEPISCGDTTRTLLAELPIQYADFAAWQQQWLQAEVWETQISYWHQQLNGAPSLLELPTDYPRPAIQSFSGARHSFSISPEQTQALKILSQQQGCTLFMTLLATFKTLLHRYTGSNDLVVGTPIANRNRSEIEGLIGFFVNTLVLRTDLSGNPRWRELLHRVREVSLGAYAHQDMPFEQLVEHLQPQRNLSYAPLFQVMFVLQNPQNSHIELSGLTLSTVETNSNNHAKFDLTLDISETPDGLIAKLEYNTDLFTAQTIQQMTGVMQTLLCKILANPEARLSDLPILTTI